MKEESWTGFTRVRVRFGGIMELYAKRAIFWRGN